MKLSYLSSIKIYVAEKDAKKGLKEIKIQSPDKLILGHLNINSVRNKFEALTYIIDNNIDLLRISENWMILSLQSNFK